jgi:MscS family membrane protein
MNGMTAAVVKQAARRLSALVFAVAAGGVTVGTVLLAQTPPAPPAAAPPRTTAPPAPPRDTLGRDTPRGTLLGFMNAGREGRTDVARLYLDTRLRDQAAIELAQKLYALLDRRLSTRITDISDQPEGSRASLVPPDQDTIDTIKTSSGSLAIVLERSNRGSLGPVWLFSRKTLDAVPDAYDDLDLDRFQIDRLLPDFLTRPRIGGIRLAQWIGLILLIPIGLGLTALVGRVFVWSQERWRRRHGHTAQPFFDGGAPGFVTLLLLAVLIHWLVLAFDLSLRERHVWTSVAGLLVILGVAWGLLRLNKAVGRSVDRRARSAGRSELTAIVGLVRRMADGIVLAASGLVTLNYFGADPTAALAGLGIGGIAVALAAQKTLENVIGGLSIIFDKAVRVGDFLKIGDMVGTVDSIGLRSTRIRTLDRTIISVPNGQVANANIETISDRDKFWFHHVLGLQYDATAEQLRATIDGIRVYLHAHPAIDPADTIRVRFVRASSSSLDVDVFAYVLAPDWDRFLSTQQELLFDILGILERSGTAIAFPTQTLHVADKRKTIAAAAAAAPTRVTAADTTAAPSAIAGGV